MKCTKFRRLIHAYIDGELDGPGAGRVGQHLDHCPHCRDYHARMQDTRNLIRRIPSIEAPATLTYMVHSSLGMSLAMPQSSWYSTLQFRLLEFSWMERMRAAFAAVPIAVLLFIAISLMVYSPLGIHNLQMLLDNDHASAFEQNLVERQYLANMLDFSPETLSQNRVYQPRISTIPVKLFAENDFQQMPANHLGVVAHVREDGRTELESVSSTELDVQEKVRLMLDSSIIFPAISLSDKKTIDSKVVLTFEKIVVKG